MKQTLISLTEDSHLKELLYQKSNRKQLKYFLETFLELTISTKMEMFYKEEFNHVKITEEGIISDLVIKFEDNLIKIKTYHTKTNDFIIHFLIGKSNDEYGKLLELRFTANIKEEKEIITTYSFANKKEPEKTLFKDLIQIKVIDLNRLNELENSNSFNRWIKFIGAKNRKELQVIIKEDKLLKELYQKL